MEKDFMKLLKAYIDKMQEHWKAGEYYGIHTLAVAIADMTKTSDMLDLLMGFSRGPKETLQAAAKLIIEDEKKGEH